MTDQERQQIKALIVTMSMYYGRKLEDAVVRMYLADLDDLPFDRVVVAFREYRRDPKHRQMPLPADIRARLQPQSTDEEVARDVASRVVEAVSKYGWNNWPRAKEYIGEIGALIVQREGGWENLCRRLTDEELNTFKAQARELARALIVRSRAGTLDQAPALPGREGTAIEQKGPTAIGAVLPQIAKQENENG